MREIGLYYPYFHVRDDVWLKTAALYLPQVARVRPPRYPVRDSVTAAVLRDELDFLRDVDPGPQAVSVAREFETLVDREEERLRRYRLPPAVSARYRPHPPVPEADRNRSRRYRRLHRGHLDETDETRFAWIHTSQLGVPASFDYREWERSLRREIPLPPELMEGGWQWSPPTPFLDRLCELGLATRRRGDPLTGTRDDFQWVGMHPRLVAVYSCVLANRIAQANALTPVTHDPRLFALPSHQTVDELSAIFLEDPAPNPPTSGRASVLYACTAVQTVIPAGIEQVPVEKIVQARRELSDEFDAFRAHVEALSEDFALLDGVEDPGILQSQLESMVERDLTKPVRELERGLRRLGMEPVRAVLGLKSLELPTVAALAAHAFQLSPIAGAGGAIALQLLASTRTARLAAAERRNSASGYLLGLRRELDPIGVVRRARRALFGNL